MSDQPSSPSGILTAARIEEFRKEYRIPPQPGDGPWVCEENEILNAICDAALSSLSAMATTSDLRSMSWARLKELEGRIGSEIAYRLLGDPLVPISSSDSSNDSK